jgi:ELP3 family radical SAM enzyme/protein acetyltransferase
MFDPNFSSNYTTGDIEGIFNTTFKQHILTQEDEDKLEGLFKLAEPIYFENIKQYNRFILNTGRRKLRLPPYSKGQMRKAYTHLLEKEKIEMNSSFLKFLKNKLPRGQSGVNVVTIFTSGHQMGKHNEGEYKDLIKKGGCPMDCFYCPFEKDENGVPTQPRSYLSSEPGNMRATQNKHHPVGQTLSRIFQLEATGHISANPNDISKIEGIISGGTFNFYPKDYIRWFTTCFYFACNNYYQFKDCNEIEMGTLEEEQHKNETTSLRVIGLTIETRPDYVAPVDKKNPDIINLDEVRFFRELGVTRVQIGFQHTDDAILKKVNRQCDQVQNKRGLRILKNNGIKSDIHIMFDLPGSSPEKDIECINTIVDDPDYQADQWKLYPTETTPFTRIKKWRDEGKYKPYAEDHTHGLSYKLAKVIIHSLERVPPQVRVNRVIRDIPHKDIEGGVRCGNFRQVVQDQMEKNGILPKDIRQREVKLGNFDSNNCELFVQHYEGSGGNEYFISYESRDKKTLYGFFRLRLNRSWDETMDNIKGHAFGRELHVYGQHTNVGDNHTKSGTQHRGLGGKLLKIGEEIAFRNGFKEISIISGIGVREYYRKKGYHLNGTYMTKTLKVGMFPSIIIDEVSFYLGLAMIFISLIITFMNYMNML